MLDAGCVQQANRGLTGGGDCKALLQPEDTEPCGGGKEEEEGLWW